MEEMERLYKDYKPLVNRYLYAICQDSLLAEEITQETFFQILTQCCVSYKFVPERFFRKREPVENQICHFARRLLIRELGRKEREQPAEFAFSFSAEVPAMEYLPEASAIDQSELDEVYEKIRSLREPMRNVIFLRYYGKRSYKEIAACLEQSENWVKYMLHSGKVELERKIGWSYS